MTQQKKVAVFDGNMEVGRQIAERLQSEGFEVCAVTDNGAEGLRRIEEEQPDIAIVGLVLKELDGFGVLDRLKGAQERVRVIAIGSFSDDEIVSRVLAKGAKYYLMKPVSPELIAARAKELSAPEEQASPVQREKRTGATLDEKISNIFISIGIPPHIKGYAYLREGIKMAVDDPSIINNVTKQLYPRIAEKFSTTASKVERAIRHSIEVAWNRQRIDAINAVFGVRVYIGTDKPTNSEFIALVADKLILEGLVKG